MVVDQHRGNRCDQAERGGQQGLGDARCDHRQVGGVAVGDADEAVHDAPHPRRCPVAAGARSPARCGQGATRRVP
ncbi:hypothetical protein G6F66_015015 [Rhizopus arrhizus]|nr:hypothetical protein G6F66_015015 [Rhizopus arrhizus]